MVTTSKRLINVFITLSLFTRSYLGSLKTDEITNSLNKNIIAAEAICKKIDAEWKFDNENVLKIDPAKVINEGKIETLFRSYSSLIGDGYLDESLQGLDAAQFYSVHLSLLSYSLDSVISSPNFKTEYRQSLARLQNLSYSIKVSSQVFSKYKLNNSLDSKFNHGKEIEISGRKSSDFEIKKKGESCDFYSRMALIKELFEMNNDLIFFPCGHLKHAMYCIYDGKTVTIGNSGDGIADFHFRNSNNANQYSGTVEYELDENIDHVIYFAALLENAFEWSDSSFHSSPHRMYTFMDKNAKLKSNPMSFIVPQKQGSCVGSSFWALLKGICNKIESERLFRIVRYGILEAGLNLINNEMISQKFLSLDFGVIDPWIRLFNFFKRHLIKIFDSLPLIISKEYFLPFESRERVFESISLKTKIKELEGPSELTKLKITDKNFQIQVDLSQDTFKFESTYVSNFSCKIEKIRYESSETVKIINYIKNMNQIFSNDQAEACFRNDDDRLLGFLIGQINRLGSIPFESIDTSFLKEWKGDATGLNAKINVFLEPFKLFSNQLSEFFDRKKSVDLEKSQLLTTNALNIIKKNSTNLNYLYMTKLSWILSKYLLIIENGSNQIFGDGFRKIFSQTNMNDYRDYLKTIHQYNKSDYDYYKNYFECSSYIEKCIITNDFEGESRNIKYFAPKDLKLKSNESYIESFDLFVLILLRGLQKIKKPVVESYRFFGVTNVKSIDNFLIENTMFIDSLNIEQKKQLKNSLKIDWNSKSENQIKDNLLLLNYKPAFVLRYLMKSKNVLLTAFGRNLLLRSFMPLIEVGSEDFKITREKVSDFNILFDEIYDNDNLVEFLKNGRKFKKIDEKMEAKTSFSMLNSLKNEIELTLVSDGQNMAAYQVLAMSLLVYKFYNNDVKYLQNFINQNVQVLNNRDSSKMTEASKFKTMINCGLSILAFGLIKNSENYTIHSVTEENILKFFPVMFWYYNFVLNQFEQVNKIQNLVTIISAIFYNYDNSNQEFDIHEIPDEFTVLLNTNSKNISKISLLGGLCKYKTSDDSEFTTLRSERYIPDDNDLIKAIKASKQTRLVSLGVLKGEITFFVDEITNSSESFKLYSNQTASFIKDKSDMIFKLLDKSNPAYSLLFGNEMYSYELWISNDFLKITSFTVDPKLCITVDLTNNLMKINPGAGFPSLSKISLKGFVNSKQGFLENLSGNSPIWILDSDNTKYYLFPCLSYGESFDGEKLFIKETENIENGLKKFSFVLENFEYVIEENGHKTLCVSIGDLGFVVAKNKFNELFMFYRSELDYFSLNRITLERFANRTVSKKKFTKYSIEYDADSINKNDFKLIINSRTEFLKISLWFFINQKENSAVQYLRYVDNLSEFTERENSILSKFFVESSNLTTPHQSIVRFLVKYIKFKNISTFNPIMLQERIKQLSDKKDPKISDEEFIPDFEFLFNQIGRVSKYLLLKIFREFMGDTELFSKNNSGPSKVNFFKKYFLDDIKCLRDLGLKIFGNFSFSPNDEYVDSVNVKEPAKKFNPSITDIEIAEEIKKEKQILGSISIISALPFLNPDEDLFIFGKFYHHEYELESDIFKKDNCFIKYWTSSAFDSNSKNIKEFLLKYFFYCFDCGTTLRSNCRSIKKKLESLKNERNANPKDDQAIKSMTNEIIATVSIAINDLIDGYNSNSSHTIYECAKDNLFNSINLKQFTSNFRRYSKLPTFINLEQILSDIGQSKSLEAILIHLIKNIKNLSEDDQRKLEDVLIKQYLETYKWQADLKPDIILLIFTFFFKQFAKEGYGADAQLVRLENLKAYMEFQKEIENDNQNYVFLKMMGGGKTKVLTPLFIAYIALIMKKLPILVLPSALLNQSGLDVNGVMIDYFGIGSDTLVCRRDKDFNTKYNLSRILLTLKHAIELGNFIIIEPTTIQCFQNNLVEAYYNFENESDGSKFGSKLGMGPEFQLAEILDFIKKNSIAIIDEVDSCLDPELEYNFPVGKILSYEKYKIRLVFRYIKELFELKESENREEIENLIGMQKQFCDQFKSNKLFEFEDCEKLIKETNDFFLDAIKTKPVNERYGLSRRQSNDFFAIPYEAANTPSEGSTFSDFWTTMRFTIMYYLEKGINTIHGKHILNSLLKKADAEINIIKSTGLDITDSKSAKLLYEIGIEPNIANLDNEHCTKILCEYFNNHKNLLEFFIIEFVSETIRVYDKQIVNSSINVATAFSKFVAFSGTLENELVLPNPKSELNRLKSLEAKKTDFDVEREMLSDFAKLTTKVNDLDKPKILGSIFNRMNEPKYLESASIFQYILDKKTDLETNLKRILVKDNYNGIFDVAAFFKDFSNKNICETILSINDYQYLGCMYFDDQENIIVGINRSKKTFKNVSVGEFQSLLAISNSKPIFAYYDQRHTTGVDLKFDDDSKFLLTFDKNVRTRDLAQGIMRARKFLPEMGKPGQTVSIAHNFCKEDPEINNFIDVWTAANAKTIAKLKIDMIGLSQKKLEQPYFVLFMENLIRNIIENSGKFKISEDLLKLSKSIIKDNLEVEGDKLNFETQIENFLSQINEIFGDKINYKYLKELASNCKKFYNNPVEPFSELISNNYKINFEDKLILGLRHKIQKQIQFQIEEEIAEELAEELEEEKHIETDMTVSGKDNYSEIDKTNQYQFGIGLKFKMLENILFELFEVDNSQKKIQVPKFPEPIVDISVVASLKQDNLIDFSNIYFISAVKNKNSFSKKSYLWQQCGDTEENKKLLFDFVFTSGQLSPINCLIVETYAEPGKWNFLFLDKNDDLFRNHLYIEKNYFSPSEMSLTVENLTVEYLENLNQVLFLINRKYEFSSSINDQICLIEIKKHCDSIENLIQEKTIDEDSIRNINVHLKEIDTIKNNRRCLESFFQSEWNFSENGLVSYLKLSSFVEKNFKKFPLQEIENAFQNANLNLNNFLIVPVESFMYNQELWKKLKQSTMYKENLKSLFNALLFSGTFDFLNRKEFYPFVQKLLENPKNDLILKILFQNSFGTSKESISFNIWKKWAKKIIETESVLPEDVSISTQVHENGKLNLLEKFKKYAFKSKCKDNEYEDFYWDAGQTIYKILASFVFYNSKDKIWWNDIFSEPKFDMNIFIQNLLVLYYKSNLNEYLENNFQEIFKFLIEKSYLDEFDMVKFLKKIKNPNEYKEKLKKIENLFKDKISNVHKTDFHDFDKFENSLKKKILYVHKTGFDDIDKFLDTYNALSEDNQYKYCSKFLIFKLYENYNDSEFDIGKILKTLKKINYQQNLNLWKNIIQFFFTNQLESKIELNSCLKKVAKTSNFPERYCKQTILGNSILDELFSNILSYLFEICSQEQKENILKYYSNDCTFFINILKHLDCDDLKNDSYYNTFNNLLLIKPEEFAKQKNYTEDVKLLIMKWWINKFDFEVMKNWPIEKIILIDANLFSRLELEEQKLFFKILYQNRNVKNLSESLVKNIKLFVKYFDEKENLLIHKNAIEDLEFLCFIIKNYTERTYFLKIKVCQIISSVLELPYHDIDGVLEFYNDQHFQILDSDSKFKHFGFIYFLIQCKLKDFDEQYIENFDEYFSNHEKYIFNIFEDLNLLVNLLSKAASQNIKDKIFKKILKILAISLDCEIDNLENIEVLKILANNKIDLDVLPDEFFKGILWKLVIGFEDHIRQNIFLRISKIK